MELTSHLSLPLLAAGQASKHVTVNDALTALDSLVHLSVLSRQVAAPPSGAIDGQRFLVPSGASGAWAGHDDGIALRQAGTWVLRQPGTGWLVWIEDENRALVRTDTGWQALISGDGVFDTVSVGLQADQIRRLALASDASLFSHAGADHRLTINKAAAASTASLVFQTGFSGRAEIGLAGSDGFSLKVSGDGTQWQTAFSVAQTSGAITANHDLQVQGLRIGHGEGATQNNTIVGAGIGGTLTTGSHNTLIGFQALRLLGAGVNNVAIGSQSLWQLADGVNNVAVGAQSLFGASTGHNNVALGVQALSTLQTWSNCVGLGLQAQVTGSNQIQLGNSSTTTYVYGTVQNRSDRRDKSDIVGTQLGLDFICRLRPVDFRWDLREDYRVPPPAMPDPSDAAAMADWEEAMQTWRDASRLDAIVRDGSRKRTRLHSGLIAQDVAAVTAALGLSWGGLQDHAINGGDPVMTLGYDQFIAPLIKAVQELSARVAAIES